VATDPTLIVAEELREAQTSLQSATAQRRHNVVRDLLLEIRLLEEALTELVPTTAKGAGALLRVVAANLAWTEPDFAADALPIAGRLEAGYRELPDLVRLRRLIAVLQRRGNAQATRTALLLTSVVAGAAKPVVVSRSQHKSQPRRETGARAV